MRKNEIDPPCPSQLHFKIFQTISSTHLFQEYSKHVSNMSANLIGFLPVRSETFREFLPCPDPLAQSSSQLEVRQ